MANVISHAEFLNDLRHGWGPDKHAVNHFKTHVWFKSCEGGYTECCEYENPCERHAKMQRGECDA